MADDDPTQVEQLPADSVASYDAVFGELPVIVALHRQGRVLYLNRAGERGIGATSRDQWLGRELETFSPADEHALVRSRLGAARESRVTAPLRHARLRRLDGTLFDVDVMTVPVTIGGVEVAQSVATAGTVVERPDEKFATAFRASPDGIVIVRLRDFAILDANPAWCALAGAELEAIAGRALDALPVIVRSEGRRELVARLQREGRARDLALEYRRVGSPEWRHLLVSAETLDADGERCVLAIARDVTEDRLLQARLRQSQKMDAVGQLAGGIAHDFNNLLTVIRANAELVIDDLAPTEPSHEDLGSIVAACDRAAALTRQLLAFSRTQALDIRDVDLNDTLRTAGGMISRLLGPSIALDWRLGDVRPVLADRGQVEQILMNLLVNARDAMPDGGVISIETAPAAVTHETFREHVTGIAAVPGDYVRWTVTDRGEGMPPETLAHAFEPFFTTKPAGTGTGLGLATVYGIVKQSQGYIWIDSTPGAGTSVHVYLPVAARRD
ncbi:MAG TPA: ATP-binding protein [Gemmatimonadaceae bacterium]|jgi:PAS domain S-box-containing protein|nr:ATP-binding protein [Gemmatimonadaceae bacterium]